MTSLPIPAPSRAWSRGRIRPFVPWIAFILLYAVTVSVAPGYLGTSQLGSLLELASILGIVAIGQTLVMLVGGIDLSVGAVVTLANLMTAALVDGRNENLAVALVATLAVGAAVGLVNGAIITILKVPDLIATLATMTIVTGAGYLATNGAPRGSSSPILEYVMTEKIFWIFTPGSILWFVLAAITIVLLRRSIVGRRVYAVGLNRVASHASGISVNGTIVGLYVASGLCASIAGILLTGYAGSSYLGSGETYQLATISAVVLGGTSIFGGYGGYAGTIAGVAITVLLLSLLQIVGITQAGQNIVYGAVILLMLAVFTVRRSTRGR